VHIFHTGFFWFVEGIFVSLSVLGLKIWTEDRGIPMPFWKWLLLAIWVLLFGFTIAFVGTSLGEREGTAAWLGGLIFGLISIVSGVGLWRLLDFGKRIKKRG
jgi:hypothetical protein